ncbi:MAG TPA: hypothetical protein VK658_20140 [Chryseolinea sp.]|nr:hypothetical protein [Chryseolinea sp.]
MTDPKSGASSEPIEINFTLSVDALLTGEKVSKISFNLDLNPDDRVLEINEHLSSRAGLTAIFKDLNRVLDEIARRTEVYNSMISIKPVPGFDQKYVENIKPTFGKIESIDYRHESPGAANVMYARRYNGDLQPPSL